MHLSDKLIIITGGSQGLGKAMAKSFIGRGARVVLISKDTDQLAETAKEISALAHYTADVRDEQGLRNIAESVEKQFGRIDMWVNNAGVFRTFPKKELIDMDRAHEMIDTNFFGMVFGCRTALRSFSEGGGTILNILSSAGLDATRAKNAKLYAATKWAMRGWIEAFRSENEGSPLSIFSVYPGGFKSEMYGDAVPKAFEQYMEADYVADKILENIERESPELDLVIKRPAA